MWWVKPNSRAWGQSWEFTARHSQTPLVSCLVMHIGQSGESEIVFMGGLLVDEIAQIRFHYQQPCQEKICNEFSKMRGIRREFGINEM